jgi:hypothetical protein
MRSEGIAPSILNLGIRWRWKFNFAKPTLLLGKAPQVPIGQKAGWSQSPFWRYWRENSVLLLVIESPVTQSLYWLSYPGSYVVWKESKIIGEWICRLVNIKVKHVDIRTAWVESVSELGYIECWTFDTLSCSHEDPRTKTSLWCWESVLSTVY